jgi:hypothetical protein
VIKWACNDMAPANQQMDQASLRLGPLAEAHPM